MPDRSDFLAAFEAFQDYTPYPEQINAIFSDGLPLWILAGPGTGKTEVLVLRTLRLLLLDGIPPEAIVLTTFTERAARNLYDRLAAYMTGFMGCGPFRHHPRPDIARIWLGTLHSVAHRMLLDMDDDVEELELLDETASLFVFLTCLTSKHTYGHDADALYSAVAGTSPAPWEGRIQRAAVLLGAVNRVVEDNLDRNALAQWRPIRGPQELWPSPAVRAVFFQLLASYETKLGLRVDFPRVQARLLQFLTSARARAFLRGDETRRLPSIRHVIVDEYQDTNPIQEAIYFALARPSRSLTVVGDDDQALYRFRGASVDAMVQFQERCRDDLAVPKVAVAKLHENRRSHPKIVQSINTYIKATDQVARFGTARTPKSPLIAKASVAGSHAPVAVLVRETEADCADEIANTIVRLQKDGAIQDYRQVALLAPSTREIGQNAFRSYVNSLEANAISVFNPRAKDLHKDAHLLAVLGALITVLDPNNLYARGRLAPFVKKCRRMLDDLPGAAALRQWATRRAREYQKPALTNPTRGERFFDEAMLDLYYKIVAHEPLRSELDAAGGPVAALRSWRLGQLSALLRGFDESRGGNNIPRATYSSRQFFYLTGGTPPAELRGPDPWYVYNFTRDLMGAFESGGFDDAEDDILAFPRGMVPALTIHQAKGLEFSIVIVFARQLLGDRLADALAPARDDRHLPSQSQVHAQPPVKKPRTPADRPD